MTSILENQAAYNIVENEKEDSAEITMYGEVVTNRPGGYYAEKKDSRLYIVLGEFLNDMEKVKNRSKVTVRINSPGGELYAGLAIMNRLAELKGDVITIVDGLAASAASIILQGGKTRKVHNGSMVMVHGASSFLFGYYNEAKLAEAEKQLNAANRAAIEAYSQRMDIGKDEIRSIMARTEWMTGQEAIKKGFADELIETGNVSMSISKDNAYMTVNGIRMPTAGFESLPVGLKVDDEMVIPGEEPVVAEKKINEGGRIEMTAEELRKQYPELVAEIEAGAVSENGRNAGKNQKEEINRAVEDERKRISEIDEIACMVGDKELLKRAKFEEPMSAAQLALEAMKRQAELGAKFISDSREDLKKSGANGVTPAPNADMSEEISQEDIAAGAALIAGIKEGE